MKKNSRITFLSVFGPDTKTSYGIMSQIANNCDRESHRFLITSYEDCMDRFPKLYEFEDLLFIPKTRNRLKKIKFFYDLLKRSDHIIFHSLYFTSYKYNLFLLFFQKFLKKAVWVEWGADLYLWKLDTTSLKNRVKNYIAKTIREKFSAVAFTFPVNEEVFFEQFHSRPATFYTPMPNPILSPTGLMDLIDSLKPVPDKGAKDKYNYLSIANDCSKRRKKEENADSTNFLEKKHNYLVQIAHNAFTFNHHVKLINYMKKFIQNDVEFNLPLAYGVYGINGAYGGKEYLNAVCKYAKETLGDKLQIITESLPFNEYVQFLWSVDVAIFDFDRPCGLGNIRILLYMGKKVFLPAESSFYKFLQSVGIKVYDTNMIPHMTFEEFVSPPTENDLSWIQNYMNNENSISHWQKMFDELASK